MDSIKARIFFLENKINHYNQMYFQENINEISDQEYDCLVKELEDLKEKYPKLGSKNSPLKEIEPAPISLKKIEREIPMLSIKRTYDFTEYEKIVSNLLTHDSMIILEPKIDGVALAITYENGFVKVLSLRGNGWNGENIISQIDFINNIKKEITGFNGEIRGEVIIEKKTGIANRRNFVAGALRRKTPKKCGLKFFPYKIFSANISSQLEGLNFLKKNFEIPKYEILDNPAHIKEKTNIILEANYEYDIDGIVAKINDYDIHDKLGYSNKYSKATVALKSISAEHKTKIESIQWHMNRKKEYIPVASISQIYIDGAKMNKISLYNAKNIIVNQIGVGSEIGVSRIGGVIPKMTKVFSNRRPDLIQRCKSCDFILNKNEIHLICLNEDCPEGTVQQLIYFSDQIGIKTLEEKSLRRMILVKNIKTINSFLKEFLDGDWIQNVNDQKSLDNFKKLQIDLLTVLASLGIEGVSKNSIKLFFHNKKDLNISDLENIKEQEGKKYITFKNFIEKNKKEIIEIWGLLNKI